MLSEGSRRQSGSMYEPAQPELVRMSFHQALPELLQNSFRQPRKLTLADQMAQTELLHMSSFLQAQNFTMADQMKPVGNQAQSVCLGFGPSQEYTPQSQLSNSTEWNDRAYYSASPVCFPNQMSMLSEGGKRESGSMHEPAQPELLHMSPFHQAQNFTIAGQMKPVGSQAQSVCLGFGPLQESTPQSQPTNSTEWVDRAYCRILQLKEMFLPYLLSEYKRSQELRRTANDPQTLDKCGRMIISAKRLISFLSMSRFHVSRWKKEKLFENMNNIMKLENQAKASNTHAQKQSQPIVGPNNRVCSQNIIQFNNSQQLRCNNQAYAAHPNNPAQLNNKNVSPTLNNNQPNSQTMKRQRENKKQVVQKKKANVQKKTRRSGGLTNQGKPPLPPVSGVNSPQKFFKSVPPSMSTLSCAFPSPLVPLTPCSKPADFAKSPLSVNENCKFTSNSAAPTLQDTRQNLIVADAHQGTISPIANTESGEKQSSCERLVNVTSAGLFQEIEEINESFLEVKVDVMNTDVLINYTDDVMKTDDVSMIGFDDCIRIRCSYVPIGPASKHMIHRLLLELFVPANYPAISPTVYEEMHRDCGDSEEGKYMWAKAKSSFRMKLGSFSQPITVKQMASAWEASAREVIVECTENWRR
ncbi:hypothetical protein CASFOL_019396 [Castilleja foliolosa]|uniref:ARC105/Med15 mediator subunit C-terminal domain-containing protein n=1 Tax=Castilleja foliolosa TaxID=1961234 RepID=A0ABD3D8M2_9LAMI